MLLVVIKNIISIRIGNKTGIKTKRKVKMEIRGKNLCISFLIIRVIS